MRKKIFVLAIFFTLAFIISSTGLGSVAVQKCSSPPIMRLTQEEVMETTLVSSDELNNYEYIINDRIANDTVYEAFGINSVEVIKYKLLKDLATENFDYISLSFSPKGGRGINICGCC